MDIDCRTMTMQTPTEAKQAEQNWQTIAGSRRRGQKLEAVLGGSSCMGLDLMEDKTIQRKTKWVLEQTPTLMIYDEQKLGDGNVCGQRMLTHVLQHRMVSYPVLKMIAQYEENMALSSPDPSVRASMAKVLDDGPLVTECGITHELALKACVKHMLGPNAWQNYDMSNKSKFKELFDKALNVCVAWKGKGSIDHWACSVLYSVGRLWDMDSISTNGLPRMITTTHDEIEIDKASESAWAYLQSAPSKMLRAFAIVVSDEKLAEASKFWTNATEEDVMDYLDRRRETDLLDEEERYAAEQAKAQAIQEEAAEEAKAAEEAEAAAREAEAEAAAKAAEEAKAQAIHEE